MAQKGPFSEKQIRAIELLASGAANYDTVAEQIGIGRRTLYRWRQLPEFYEAVIAEARRLLKDDLPRIYASLSRQAISFGNIRAIELALKSTGEYVEKQTLEHAGSIKIENPLERIAEYEEVIIKGGNTVTGDSRRKPAHSASTN